MSVVAMGGSVALCSEVGAGLAVRTGEALYIHWHTWNEVASAFSICDV
jgi:hypothetical protein